MAAFFTWSVRWHSSLQSLNMKTVLLQAWLCCVGEEGTFPKTSNFLRNSFFHKLKTFRQFYASRWHSQHLCKGSLCVLEASVYFSSLVKLLLFYQMADISYLLTMHCHHTQFCLFPMKNGNAIPLYSWGPKHLSSFYLKYTSIEKIINLHNWKNAIQEF